MIVCLAANPSIDKLFEIDRLVKGDIHRPQGFVQVAGGKGLNVARAAHSLGANVTAAALLRGHAGRWLEEQLIAEGVPGAYVWTHGENRSSLSVADRETGSLTEFYEHGAVAPEMAWTELVQIASEAWTMDGWLTISGSLPRGAPDDGYRDLVKEAREAGVRVALDAEGERLRLALEAHPDIVKVNQAEARELLGVPTARREEALTAAAKLRDLAGGDGHAGLVTRGAEGVVLAAPDGTLFEGMLYVRGRYPVGSGDAFLAGLLAGLDRGDPWDRSLCIALGAATANAEIAGAGKLDPARAAELTAQAVVEDRVSGGWADAGRRASDERRAAPGDDGVAQGTDTVERKVTIPARGARSVVASLGMDPMDAQPGSARSAGSSRRSSVRSTTITLRADPRSTTCRSSVRSTCSS